MYISYVTFAQINKGAGIQKYLPFTLPKISTNIYLYYFMWKLPIHSHHSNMNLDALILSWLKIRIWSPSFDKRYINVCTVSMSDVVFVVSVCQLHITITIIELRKISSLHHSFSSFLQFPESQIKWHSGWHIAVA